MSFGVFGRWDEGSIRVYALLWVVFEGVYTVVCGGSGSVVLLLGVLSLGVIFHALENLMWYLLGVG